MMLVLIRETPSKPGLHWVRTVESNELLKQLLTPPGPHNVLPQTLQTQSV
jgi:hypothetical protein